jgi:DNA-binding protein H-NS
MATSHELKTQLADLSRQAEEARALEIQAVVDDIRAKVAEYGLTEKDIFGRRRRAQAERASSGIPRYRDPETGAEWTGHGRAPAWIKAVKNRDNFLIAGPARSAPVRHTSRKAAGKGAASEKATSGKVAQKKAARRAKRGAAGKATAQATD